mgnify:FL=1
MFSFFKKKEVKAVEPQTSFEIELTAAVLAYEIARSDGSVDKDELKVLLEEIERISEKVGKEPDKILDLIETYSKNSVSFHEFIEDINKSYSKQDKLSLIEFMWRIAFADGKLDVDEERLVRRIADLIKIKDVEVLKLKEASRQ